MFFFVKKGFEPGEEEEVVGDARPLTGSTDSVLKKGNKQQKGVKLWQPFRTKISFHVVFVSRLLWWRGRAEC